MFARPSCATFHAFPCRSPGPVPGLCVFCENPHQISPGILCMMSKGGQHAGQQSCHPYFSLRQTYVHAGGNHRLWRERPDRHGQRLRPGTARSAAGHRASPGRRPGLGMGRRSYGGRGRPFCRPPPAGPGVRGDGAGRALQKSLGQLLYARQPPQSRSRRLLPAPCGFSGRPAPGGEGPCPGELCRGRHGRGLRQL